MPRKSTILYLAGKPVLMNRLLSTHQRHQSRVKYNGIKGKYFGIKFIHEQMVAQSVPRYRKPVSVTINIHHRTNNVFDFDAPLKTLLDGIKQSDKCRRGLVDDNIKGLKILIIKYVKSDEDAVEVVFQP